MARMNNDWFEFGGVKSSDQFIEMVELPEISRPPRREYDPSYIDGRDGALWGSDEDYYDPFEIPIRFRTTTSTNDRVISAWLQGSGWLRFSESPGYAYKARILRPFQYVRVQGSTVMKTVEVTFLVEPFKYTYPIPTYTLIKGGTLTNPGTRFARPKITLNGSGDIVLTIKDRPLVIIGLSGSIVIDCEAGVVSNGSINLGHKIDREGSVWPYIISPGDNLVTWTGTISSNTLQGNWVSY